MIQWNVKPLVAWAKSAWLEKKDIQNPANRSMPHAQNTNTPRGSLAVTGAAALGRPII